MAKAPLSHFSPVFANRPWEDGGEYTCYSRNPYRQTVERSPKGPRQWGRKRGLYKWKVETALNQDLENDASKVYSEILKAHELSDEQRVTWAQFLLSQFVRTPGFLRYELAARKIFGIEAEPEHDRVGCKECGDLACITTRDWCLLVASEGDYFIRSDNPVLLTGFIERAQTCLLYPVSPRLCFVACSMPESWNFLARVRAPKFFARRLPKGAALMVNFHLAKAADESIIIRPSNDGKVAETMFTGALGVYTQPPFLLHTLEGHDEGEAFESIRILMSGIDRTQYPPWLPCELEGLFFLESAGEEPPNKGLAANASRHR
jgi:Protein of unknown function (DUF4238)